MDIQQFEARKREHIQYSLNRAHQALGLSGLEQIHLIHDALPDLQLSEVQLASRCLGKELPTPFYIAGMTAGHEDAFRINRTLALACQERGWAMGVGSQRRDLEAQRKSKSTDTMDLWKELRKETPNLTLFANIGLTQLISASVTCLRNLVDELGATALVVHTNALQEALQVEGTPDFKGGLSALIEICEALECPVVLKETGCGFSTATLERLKNCGLGAIDVSGLGGTHWGRIEGARAPVESVQAAAARTFANWGESTVESVLSAVQIIPREIEVWASGGVRSGLDAAKLVALGAHRVGYAQPALEAALVGSTQLLRWMEVQEYELKVALFCTGSRNCEALRQKEHAWKIR